MIIRSFQDVHNTEREVVCPNGGFVSHRYLLRSDGMGFSMTRTFIPKGSPQIWHYKNHLEACYCTKGKALLRNLETGEDFEIVPGTMYALNLHDKHEFTAIENTELICVFNPPLSGREVHDEDRSYKISEDV